MDRPSKFSTTSALVSTPRKSLAIPKKSPPDDYRAYIEHPEVATLNQVMLHYLDIEEILKLYRQNHEQFETRQALNTLAKRFKLPTAANFKQLLQDYDMRYATVRSYLYTNRDPKQILIQAALEGNIQVLYNQLKLYPELRDVEVYDVALDSAAEGGHEAIIELLFELGAEDVDRTVLASAALGGQLVLVQKELAKGVKAKYIEGAISNAAMRRHKAVVAALLDYSTNNRILSSAMYGAGMSGDTTIIEYVISRGGNDYSYLIRTAATCNHFDIVRLYWQKLTRNLAWLNESVLINAIHYVNLDMVKFMVKRQLVTQGHLESILGDLKRSRRHLLEAKQRTSKPHKLERIAKKLTASDSIIAYLENKGVVSNDSNDGNDDIYGDIVDSKSD